MFHQFDDDLKHAIVLMAVREAPITREQNNKDLEAQARARQKKDEIARQENMDRVSEEYIEAMYLINMYHSDACIKDDPKNVTAVLNKLKSKTAKMRALKTNISIRVKGFGWQWAHTSWSKDGEEYSVSYLANHLCKIIRKENNMSIPTKPKVNVPKRKKVGVLGTEAEDVSTLDEEYLKGEEDFKRRAETARTLRETSGESSVFSRMQPFYRPEICELQDKRIDVLFELNAKVKGKNKKVKRWCQGKVVKVYEDRSKPRDRVD